MNELIKTHRDALDQLMAAQGLDYILMLNPGMGNLDKWLFSGDRLPTPAPFNRNSAFLIPLGGEIIKLCQTTTHPTDWSQYVHFEDAGLEQVLTDGIMGVVHPQAMKKNVRDCLAAVCPGVTIVDTTAAFEALKAKKTPEEHAALQKAAGEYDKLFQALSLIIRPERLEKEVVNEIRQRLAWQGAESETPGFHSIVELTSAPDGGASAEEPMLWPGRRLQVGDRVNVTVRGYMPGGTSAALGRSFVLGEPSEEAKKYWSIAVEAQQLAASLARPGTTLGQIAGQIDLFLEKQGLPADTSGWLHGIGTSVYEAPRNIDATRSLPLEEGMVLSIGPGVKPAGKDSYQCVDAFVVATDGAVRLSKLPNVLRGL